ncbi:MAG: hypothetical protein HC887_08890 [Desulfobacteraceae bacterium]|nr:hypothetical protein [Desulfobacteraceae bacterium]
MYLSILYAQGLQIVIDDQGITLVYLTGECGYLNYDAIHSVSETLLLPSWFDKLTNIISKHPYSKYTEYYGIVLHLKNGGSVDIWTEDIQEDNLHRLLNAMKKCK